MDMYYIDRELVVDESFHSKEDKSPVVAGSFDYRLVDIRNLEVGFVGLKGNMPHG